MAETMDTQNTVETTATPEETTAVETQDADCKEKATRGRTQRIIDKRP